MKGSLIKQEIIWWEVGIQVRSSTENPRARESAAGEEEQLAKSKKTSLLHEEQAQRIRELELKLQRWRECRRDGYL